MSNWFWVTTRRRNIKKQSGVEMERQGRLWGRGLLLCCHCLRSVVLLHREIHFLCLYVDVSSWLQLSMVWSHTGTHSVRLAHSHTDSAFTIRLRWHLNNELSLFALPRLSPPAEVHRLALLPLLIFNTNCFIQNATSLSLVCLHLNVTPAAGSFN